MDITNDDTPSNTTSSGSGDSKWELILKSGTIEPLIPTVDLENDDDDGSDSDWETDLKEMTDRERVIMERHNRGYHRHKVKDIKLYEERMAKYSRFIILEMLKQLNHCWST